MNKQVLLEDIGFKDYKESWDYQEALFQDILKIKVDNRRSGSQ